MEDFYDRKRSLLDYLVASEFLKTKNIIDAFSSVPRHNFVIQRQMEFAYDDIALPVLNDSTLSQPSTVASMLELLQPRVGENVLEIGTGSGWEACLISNCVGDKGKVVTLEIETPLYELAKQNIERMNVKNIKLINGDGSIGYNNDAPYDKIIYAVGIPEITPQILVQLKDGGRLVAPVGNKTMQTMKVVDKISEKKYESKDNGTFRFVPLKGQLGF